MDEYKPHILEWTGEKVSRFWNFYNHYPYYEGTWFTEMAGDAVVKFFQKYFKLKGRILDYGTGKGFLLQHLLEKNAPTELYACDFTESLAIQANEKFSSYKSFKGCNHIANFPSVYENNFFDFIFLIETIEHLTDNYLQSTLQEIHRILKPGGSVIITTPNAEIIEKHYVHCADCGATFHQMQHVKSWNKSSLSEICKQFKFTEFFCGAINLYDYKLKNVLQYAKYQVKKIFVKKYTPHLIFIGKK